MVSMMTDGQKTCSFELVWAMSNQGQTGKKTYSLELVWAMNNHGQTGQKHVTIPHVAADVSVFAGKQGNRLNVNVLDVSHSDRP